MDGIKEVLDALNTRIRSPIIGSFVIAFVIVNWRSLFYLTFADQLTEEKFIYFDEHTDLRSLILFPAAIGFFMAIVSPWIVLAGAHLAEIPVRKRKFLQIKSSHQILIEKESFENTRRQIKATREEALIDEAIRDQEINKIEDTEIREELEKKIDESRQENSSDITPDNSLFHKTSYALKKAQIEDKIKSLIRQKRRHDNKNELGKVAQVEEQIDQAYEALSVYPGIRVE